MKLKIFMVGFGVCMLISGFERYIQMGHSVRNTLLLIGDFLVLGCWMFSLIWELYGKKVFYGEVER
ncbi:TPA_asm: hypothetical protein vir519_00016 [Caudoviricetes sp. vir519]|nr:TPA_asm: hypothetical protein vir519_00016 [Caudoviricetes sp. vir519]